MTVNIEDVETKLANVVHQQFSELKLLYKNLQTKYSDTEIKLNDLEESYLHNLSVLAERDSVINQLSSDNKCAKELIVSYEKRVEAALLKEEQCRAELTILRDRLSETEMRMKSQCENSLIRERNLQELAEQRLKDAATLALHEKHEISRKYDESLNQIKSIKLAHANEQEALEKRYTLDLNRITASFDEKQVDYKNQLSMSQCKVETLSSSMAKSADDLEHLLQHLKDIAVENLALSTELSSCRKDRDKLHQRDTQLRSRLTQVKSHHKKDLSSLQLELKACRIRLQQAESQRDLYYHQLEEHEEYIGREAEERRGEEIRLAKALREKETEICSLSSELAARQQDVGRLRDAVEQAESRTLELQNQNGSNSSALGECFAKLRELEAENGRLKRSIAEMVNMAKRDVASKEQPKESQLVRDYHQKMELAGKKIKQLAYENSDLLRLNNVMRTKLRDLMTEGEFERYCQAIRCDSTAIARGLKKTKPLLAPIKPDGCVIPGNDALADVFKALNDASSIGSIPK